MNLVLLAIVGCLAGALLCLVFGRYPKVVSALGPGVSMLSCGFGLFAAYQALSAGRVDTWGLSWGVPNAAFSLGLDPLSSFFLIPLFALGLCAACYGRTYMVEHAKGRSLAVSWAAFNLLVLGMALVLVARHALPLLFAWELMSLAAFVLVSFDHQEASVRRASFVYLIATHVGVVCLIMLFVLLGAYAGSLEFSVMVAAKRPSVAFGSLLFVLSLIGFGAKAGLVPLHVWLPEAHAAAPSHVSALMSGVLVKMGVYGILRSVLLLGGPVPHLGQLLMGLGIVGGLLGIGCALYQRDAKRMLAYSTVENVGLILLGIGTAFYGASTGRLLLASVGLAGSLLHVWNHAAMKGLMFLAAGSLAHRCHTKDIEQLGGLLRRMPITASLMILGAVGMAGLPPLNGFISEWLLYSGLLRTVLSVDGGASVVAIVAVAALSLVGAMAALAFARLLGIALLGEPRSPKSRDAGEVSWAMQLPMGALGAACLVLAVFPLSAIQLLSPVLRQFLGPHAETALGASTGLDQVGVVQRVLTAAVVVVLVGLAARTRRRAVKDATWGCGYAFVTPRMQYTGRGLSEFFTASILPRNLGPRLLVSRPAAIFPEPGHLESDTKDPVTRGIYEPFFEGWADRFSRLRFLQQGILHIYFLYILVTLVIALGWSAFMSSGGPR